MTNNYEKTMSLIKILLMCKTADLRSDKWDIPIPSAGVMLAIQAKGFEIFGDKFRFIAYDLQAFCKSPVVSREKGSEGSVVFSSPLSINSDLIVYSGTVDTEYAAYRLGNEIATPFKDYIFTHPETQWFNIASRIGMKMYCKAHLSQILDFCASLVIMRFEQGKTCLLISKKYIKTDCAEQLTERFKARGYGFLKIVTENHEQEDLSNKNIIPMIHYGVIGVNHFQHYDAAYCLNGYYVNDHIINSILQDSHASGFHIPIEVGTSGEPLRRWARAANPAQQFFAVNWLSNSVLSQEEVGVVHQTVGRVRPHTFPREIITFQCAANPQMPYTQEFRTLQEAREFFGIQSQRSLRKTGTIEAVQKVKALGLGLTQKEIANQLGLGLRTVQRYWK